MRTLPFALLAAVLVALAIYPVVAADAPADGKFSIGEGKVTFTAPAGWKKVEPKNRIIEAEMEVPAAKGDEIAGRLTAMGAGGDIEGNIARWVAQFVAPGGEEINPQIDKLTVDGNEVHVVSLTGTYKDAPGGPFAGGKTILRENYKMLGAIYVTKAGNYFLKLYGPKATVGEAEKDFRTLVESMKLAK